MTDALDLHGVAQALHRSYDWTQRNWRRLAAGEGFPPPFVGGGHGERPIWCAALVTAWKERREPMPGGGSGHDRLAQPTGGVANDAQPQPRGDRASALIRAAG